MSVTSYDPFSLMHQLQREAGRLFDSRFSGRRERPAAAVSGEWLPLVDIQEEENQYVINADVPGVDPQDIEVSMEKNVLSLRGTRRVQPAAENGVFKRRERPGGGFHRRFVMPETADAEGITAHGKNGVLQVVIPKRQKAQTRRIQVEG